MKSIVLSSVVTALLVFSGCSSKEATVEDSQQAVKEVESVKTETGSTVGDIKSGDAPEVQDYQQVLDNLRKKKEKKVLTTPLS